MSLLAGLKQNPAIFFAPFAPFRPMRPELYTHSPKPDWKKKSNLLLLDVIKLLDHPSLFLWN
jgi:hypothetical protein